MLFGFVDEAEPLDETAELMEDLVVENVHAMVRRTLFQCSSRRRTNDSTWISVLFCCFKTKKAMELATIKGKLDTECFIFLIRNHPERYDRVAELLRANDEFRAVLNSRFDSSDENMYCNVLRMGDRSFSERRAR